MPLSTDQDNALNVATNLAHKDSDAHIMILRGSAGTGKTTLIKEIITSVKSSFHHVVLCAPTNKAAKVLRQKTGHSAGTIHKLLYMPAEDQEGIVRFQKLLPKKDEPVLIIADEASMISDRPDNSETLFGGIALLTDLLEYFHACAPESRLIFIGDPCQLPPVGYESFEVSPALDADYLRYEKGLKIEVTELREVLRQSQDSYILEGATSLRNHLLYGTDSYQVRPRFLNGITSSIHKYLEQYQSDDESRVMKIAWTNKSVNWWNMVMRERLDLAAGPLMPGSRVLIDRTRIDNLNLIQKGEIACIFDVNGAAEEFANLNFLPVTLMTFDEDGVVTREHKAFALLEHLNSERGQLLPEQEKLLKAEAMRCNEKYRKTRRAEDDPYINALRLRYAYALTCHKAQGSEYENVIVHPYQPKDDLRWLYTAVTRAKKELFTY